MTDIDNEDADTAGGLSSTDGTFLSYDMLSGDELFSGGGAEHRPHKDLSESMIVHAEDDDMAPPPFAKNYQVFFAFVIHFHLP